MNIRKEVLDYGSKEQVVKVANFIGSDEKKFAELMNLFFSPNNLHSHRASWVVSYVTDKYPWMINPYLDKLVNNLFKSPGEAIKRNTVRILQSIEIPDELWGEVIEICFQFLLNNEAAAIKAFSMTVLFNLTKHVPEIAHELKIVIEDQIPYATPGVKNRSEKILAELEKIDLGFELGK